MSTSISISCSGAFFSSLLFELMKHSKSQEGFFLGDISTVTSHSISDSQMHNENINTVINLTSFIPCSSLGTFYSGCGGVNLLSLKNLLGTDFKRVVGWYCYRGSCDELYFREMRVHYQLRNIMSHTDGYFLLALISSIQPSYSGTLDINYRFHVIHEDEYKGVSLSIVNMTDTSSSQYIRMAPSAPLYNSGSLKMVLEKIPNIEPGVSEAEQLHNGLVEQLQLLLPKYSAVQEKYQKLVEEVSQLKTICHSSGIISDFEPVTEESSSEVKIRSKSPVLSGKTKKIIDSRPSRGIESEKAKRDDDISDFVEVEKEGGAKSKDFRVNNNLSKGKTVKKVRPQTARTISPSKTKSKIRRSSGGSSSCSPVRVENCEDNPKKEVRQQHRHSPSRQKPSSSVSNQNKSSLGSVKQQKSMTHISENSLVEEPRCESQEY